jgi:hypothetical protein
VQQRVVIGVAVTVGAALIAVVVVLALWTANVSDRASDAEARAEDLAVQVDKATADAAALAARLDEIEGSSGEEAGLEERIAVVEAREAQVTRMQRRLGHITECLPEVSDQLYRLEINVDFQNGFAYPSVPGFSRFCADLFTPPNP